MILKQLRSKNTKVWFLQYPPCEMLIFASQEGIKIHPKSFQKHIKIIAKSIINSRNLCRETFPRDLQNQPKTFPRGFQNHPKPPQNLAFRFRHSKKSIPQGLSRASSIQVAIYVHFWLIFLPKKSPKWRKINQKSISDVNQVSTSFKQHESLIFAIPSRRNAHFCFSRGYQNPSKIISKAYKNPLRKL